MWKENARSRMSLLQILDTERVRRDHGCMGLQFCRDLLLCGQISPVAVAAPNLHTMKITPRSSAELGTSNDLESIVTSTTCVLWIFLLHQSVLESMTPHDASESPNIPRESRCSLASQPLTPRLWMLRGYWVDYSRRVRGC